MGVETLLVAVGEEDQDRVRVIADTVTDIAAPTGATVVITHVVSDETYRRAVEQTEEVSDRLKTGDEPPEWVERWSQVAATSQPGIEGDIPDWVERWSQVDVTRERRESFQLESLETILERKDLISELTTIFEDAGIEYEIRGAVGDPAEHVVDIAGALDVDFVVVGGRNQSSARQALFGSVSQEIIRSVRCPVISVREGVQR